MPEDMGSLSFLPTETAVDILPMHRMQGVPTLTNGLSCFAGSRLAPFPLVGALTLASTGLSFPESQGTCETDQCQPRLTMYLFSHERRNRK